MIRAATKDDIDCIAKLRNDTWKTAYKGIVSDQFLSKLDNSEKAKRFHHYLEEKDKFLCVYLDNRTNQICGYKQEAKMDHNIYEFGRKHKQMIIFIPLYLIFIFITGFVMGISFGNNDLWEKGIKRAKQKRSINS